MKYVIALLFSLMTASSFANDMALIAGKYRYEKYAVTMANGNVLSLANIGIKSINMSFNTDSTVLMEATMLNGKIVKEKAVIKEIKIKGNKGYWIARWSDINYDIREDFSFHDDVFEYEAKFQDKSDKDRYGAVERGTLKKMPFF
ncbi:hypothetical protein H8L32_09515 [Undibacterium sp. CY18W]|uniref:DUF3108 domain-containing protein n=1 Tax=Undibacterium hunanense TaxID=2762292 RepID=A0ABR6ZPI7_9BURK|nr:hypothetical protein [Undibacterium hunanense]MBC3917709.1 hypothetical protein [Undibacterium hunanense]